MKISIYMFKFKTKIELKKQNLRIKNFENKILNNSSEENFKKNL